MDELIKELERLAVEAIEERKACLHSSLMWVRKDAAAMAFVDASRLAREAKRRMAEREPAWDLQP